MAIEWTPEMHAWVERMVASTPQLPPDRIEEAARIVAEDIAERRQQPAA